jgi:hypothetical protein
VALGAIVGGWLFLFVALKFLAALVPVRYSFPNSAGAWVTAIGLGAAPGGVATLIDSWPLAGHLVILGMLAAALAHGALAVSYLMRFGRVAPQQVQSSQAAVRTRPDWLGSPMRAPLLAIAWKQFRESAPILLAAVAGMFGVVGIFLAEEPNAARDVGEVYAHVATVLGVVVALVVGIGVCYPDVSPRVNTFWRSRPINPDLWFWAKFLTGLAVLLAAIYVPILSMAGVEGTRRLARLNPSETLVFPLLHIAVFALAVAATCLVRNAVYAAILTIAATYLGVATVWFACQLPGTHRWLDVNGIFDMPAGQIAAAMILNGVVGTVVAWLAMRNDWGRKSLY